ncbi:MAG TPA: class I SAM-dependent methyltransferase [Patescibacteria group bacterium]|nr:class I SAM-dependent methyltransferase [Patescibacteria group bacterium]
MWQLLVLLGLLAYSLFLLFLISSAFSAFARTKVPFVPSRVRDIEEAIRLAKVSERDMVLDLGSGNGRVVFLFEDLGGARGFGIETGLWMHGYAKLKALFKKSNAKFVCGDIFKEPWREATVIYSYLYPPLMQRVQDKFTSEAQPGTRLVVKDFKLPSLAPKQKVDLDSVHTLYLYEL